MPGQHGTSLKDYTQALTTQLRLRKVPGKVIGQIVAEVESHVRETGEDPVAVFDQPGSYSAQFAPIPAGGSQPGRRRVREVVASAAIVVGCWMLGTGLLNLRDEVSITTKALASCLAVGLLIALIVLPLDLALEDRRTRIVVAGGGSVMSRTDQWLRFLALWGALLAGGTVNEFAPDGSVLLMAPGWALLVVGLGLVAGFLWRASRRMGRIVDPRRV